MYRRKILSAWGGCRFIVFATILICISVLMSGMFAATAAARPLQSSSAPVIDSAGPGDRVAFPVYETRLHFANRVWFALTTWGLLGTEGSNRVHYKDRLALGIDYSPSFEYPAGTRNSYLYGGSLWIGGIVGTDTLVSIAMNGVSASRDEWNAYDTVSESSSDIVSPYYHPNARADQQYFARVYDTLILNSTDGLDVRLHLPLNLEVSQTSYAWADQALSDFVIVEYWVRNIGTRPINKMVFGVYIDADVFNENQKPPNPFMDDVSGFLDTSSHPLAPSLDEALNVAWIADNNGDPVGGAFAPYSPTGAIGVRMLRTPPVDDISFNWWLIASAASQNWGPVRTGARPPAPGGGLGSPIGDRNAYYVMSNGEIDYDQFTANLDHTGDGWRPRLRAGGCDIADGLDTRFVLSAGPACDPLFPGDSIPFVVALFGGEDFHTDPQAAFNCLNPQPFMASLDYSGLARAARWAAWLYDTPGVDTDGDGYLGEYSLENGDTVFYTGDLGAPPHSGGNCASISYGGPDFVRPAAPPCPEIQVEARSASVAVHWDERLSETTRDVYLQRADFQGYRLYMSPSGAPGSYSLIGSWDAGDVVPPTNIIQRVRTDSIPTGDGQFLTYGVYEAVLTGLSPTSVTYISVTSYDSGVEELRLEPIESPIGACYAVAPPLGEQFGKSFIDITPGQCPNWLTKASLVALNRVAPLPPGEEPASELTVAVLGRDGFDVHDLIVSSVRLEGCPSTAHSYADVSSPVVRDAPCDCWAAGSDGQMDLLLRFNKAVLFGALGSMGAGEQVELELTALTSDGAPFTGHDCVTIGATLVSSAAADGANQGTKSLRSFPNPFNAATTISYAVGDTGPVTVEIFDILGRRVSILIDEVQSEGSHTVTWNGTDGQGWPLPSGTYLCRMSTGGIERLLKLVLLK